MAGVDESVKERARELLQTTPPPVSADDDLKSRARKLMGAQPEPGMALLVGQTELGPPGLESTGTRFRIAAADTFREKVAAFKQTFPEGELSKDPVSGELLFRASRAEDFAKVDAGLLEKFEPLGDLIDFIAPDLGSISGELLSAMRTRGISLLPLMARLFFGGAAGEVVQEVGERAAGFQFEAPRAIGERAAVKGAFGAGGGVAGKGLELGINLARGAGTVKLEPGALEAMAAAERRDVPQLLPFQVSDSPILKKIAGQAGAVLPRIQRMINKQNEMVTKALRNLRDRTELPKLGQRLADIHGRITNDILNKVQNVTRRTEASKTGEALAEGVADYSERSRLIVNDLYKTARDIETPSFNMTKALNAVDELETGQPFTTVAGETGQAARPVDPILRDVMERIKEFDPNAPSIIRNGEEFTSTDALLRLRSDLWDLKTPDPGQIARREHTDAGKLYNAITDIIDNPINANPGFTQAWQRARQSAAERFDTMDKIMVMQVAKSETPALLARRLATPFQVDNIRLLRSVVDSQKFKDFQNFFKSELLRDPDNLTQTLNKFDDETLKEIMTPNELLIFRQAGQQIDKLNSVGIREILERQNKPGSIINEAIFREDTAQVSTLFDLMQQAGGRTSPLGKSLRAGIIDNIWEAVTAIPKGQGTPEVFRAALNTKIKELRAAGALRFLRASDVAAVRDLRLVKSFTDVIADTGTSMQAGEAIGGFTDLATSAFGTILKHMGVGRFMVSGVGRRFLTGVGRKQKPFTILKAMSGALATALSDATPEVQPSSQLRTAPDNGVPAPG